MVNPNILLTMIGAAILFGTSAAHAVPTQPPATQSNDQWELLKEDLTEGSSEVRHTALLRIMSQPKSWSEMDESMIPAFAAAAEDPDEDVRREVPRIAGNRWIWGTPDQDPRVIDLMIKLATTDTDSDVRYNAVYFGLSTVNNKDDRVIGAMLSAAMRLSEYESNLHGRIAWGLRAVPPAQVALICQTHWKEPVEESKALIAYAIYLGATGDESPPPKSLEGAGTWLLRFRFKPGHGEEDRPLAATFRQHVPAELAPEIGIRGRDNSGSTVVEGAGKMTKVLRLIRDSGVLVLRDVPRPLNEEQAESTRMMLNAAADAPAAAPFEAKEARVAFHALYDHLGRSSQHNLRIKNINWKAVGEELLPLADKCKNEREFGLLCLRLVARLQDSHAQLIKGTAEPPAPDLPRFDPGFACLIDDRDRPVVYHVDTNSPAQEAGVTIGMTIVSVGGIPAADAIAAWMKETSNFYGYSSERYLRYDAAKGFMRVRENGAIVKIEIGNLQGKRKVLELPATLSFRYLSRLPVPIGGINDSGNVEAKKLSDTIGYMYVRRINGELPELLDAAFKPIGDAKGLIVDVRGNSGGGFDAQQAFAPFEKFTGPIALLIDERCISAGEGWASWFIANKRARVFGTTTAGASSRKNEYELTNRLYKVIVPVKPYTGFLDRPIEHRGLEPDVAVRCSAADLAAGRDTVLETAKKWLAEQK